LRTLIVTTSYPRWPGDPGGHFVAADAEERARHGDRVVVLAPGRGRAIEPRRGVEIRWLGGEQSFGWPGFVARAQATPLRAIADLLRVARTCREAIDDFGTADEVHAHWLVPSAWPLAPEAVPLVAHAHGGDVRLLARLPAAVRHRIVAQLAQRASSIRFAAAALRDELLDFLDRDLAATIAAKSAVAPPPLAIPDALTRPEQRSRTRARIRSAMGVTQDQPLALSLSRLVRTKRVDLAIAAVARCAPPLTLLVVGDGPDRARLQTLAEPLAGRVRFIGAVDRDRALDLLAASDVLVHPSRCEAAPSAIREARALGIPVLACAAGDIAHWTRTDAGIACVPASADAFARALAAVA
jgi:glycosyltransferase involved in cell wall biosynthesis